MFEIEFVERGTEATIRKLAPMHKKTRTLRVTVEARKRRATVRQCRPDARARLVVMALDEMSAIAVSDVLERSEVDKIAREWDIDQANSVAIAWPVGVPIPSWIERC